MKFPHLIHQLHYDTRAAQVYAAVVLQKRDVLKRTNRCVVEEVAALPRIHCWRNETVVAINENGTACHVREV